MKDEPSLGTDDEEEEVQVRQTKSVLVWWEQLFVIKGECFLSQYIVNAINCII